MGVEQKAAQQSRSLATKLAQAQRAAVELDQQRKVVDMALQVRAGGALRLGIRIILLL